MSHNTQESSDPTQHGHTPCTSTPMTRKFVSFTEAANIRTAIADDGTAWVSYARQYDGWSTWQQIPNLPEKQQ